MKKSKTIKEYLQSECDELERKREMARLEGRTPISYEDELRIIFNNLFPQIGISGRFGPEDTPIEALARLLDEADDDEQRKHLKACLQWLNGYFMPPSLRFMPPSIRRGRREQMNYHQNAEQLILLAAKQSGLLEEVAKLVAWWHQPDEKPPGIEGFCPLCVLLSMLTDGFDQFVCKPALAAEAIYGEGFDFEYSLRPRESPNQQQQMNGEASEAD
jgi:hypothetical protein